MREELTLNRKEQNRLMVLNQMESKKLRVEKVATLLELSERQFWRLIAGYRKEGAAALAHGNRGRKPANALEDSLRQKIIELAKTPYTGFHPQTFTRKMGGG